MQDTVSLLKRAGRTFCPGDRVEVASAIGWITGKVQDWTTAHGDTWVVLDRDPDGWSRPFGRDIIRRVL